LDVQPVSYKGGGLMKHAAENIKSIIQKFESVAIVKEIWEIGSRDGLDSQKMSEIFPQARIKSFEPNPDTFSMVEDVAHNSCGKITALNLAISDSDGEITFNKIDTSSTVTTWADGNPGASSMFIASEEYDIEKYFQIPVKVKSNKAKTLIENQGLATPNLIWMDAQGAEGLVIQGFGEHIANVDFIYVELSLKPLYIGQPLASEIVKLLLENFYWYSNLTKGSWQFDALFINKKYRSHKLVCRNTLLFLSLKSNLNIGIEYSFAIFLKKPMSVLKRNIIRVLTNNLRKSDSRILGSIVIKIALISAKIIKLKKLPYRVRKVISLAQPSDPLCDSVLPNIDIVIPCHEKDFENLHLVIEGARINVKNPIGKVLLITPQCLSAELQSKFPDCLVLADENVLGAEIIEVIQTLVPKERRGWITQQVIKFRVAMMSDEVASLIIDSDTILLRPRIWLNSRETQILCVGEDYHLPYKMHLRKFFDRKDNHLSFVTHHQLMKRVAVREIFGSDNQGLIRWLKLGDYSEGAAISEYDTYGEWLVSNKPDEIEFAKWNNFATKLNPLSTSYSEVAHKYWQYHSISNHSYL
jgi:FkbM family methyltransferase